MAGLLLVFNLFIYLKQVEISVSIVRKITLTAYSKFNTVVLSVVLKWIYIFCSVRQLGCHNRVNISSNKLLSTCTQLPAKRTE